MYITVRKYADKGSLVEKIVPRVRDDLVPQLKRAVGFKGYCLFPSEDGHVVSIAIFDARESATRHSEQVREWVASNRRDLLLDSPEVLAGDVLLHKEAQLRSGNQGMFAVVRAWDGVGPKDEVLPMVREHIFPILTGAPGFRGYYTFLDEKGATRGVSVSLFDTREHATAAQERVVAAMRDKRIASNPPTVLAGQTAIVAAAE